MDTLYIETSEVITKAELVEFYKDIAQQQADNYSTLFNVLLGVTVVLVGSTWLWNFILAKRQISAEVDEKVAIQFETIKGRITSIAEEEYRKIKSKLDNKLINHDANIARLFALHCMDSFYFGTALYWWTVALVNYVKTNEQDLIRICVDRILKIVEEENWYEDLEKEQHQEIIDELQKIIPSTLSIEKERIIKELKNRSPK